MLYSVCELLTLSRNLRNKLDRRHASLSMTELILSVRQLQGNDLQKGWTKNWWGIGSVGGRKCTFLLASFSSQNETVTSVCLCFRPLICMFMFQTSKNPMIQSFSLLSEEALERPWSLSWLLQCTVTLGRFAYVPLSLSPCLSSTVSVLLLSTVSVSLSYACILTVLM